MLKVVILCGGRGTRLWEETEIRPKPLVMVGDRPILWHIMNIFSAQGFDDFVLCLGYKGEMIKQYFLNYRETTRDFHLKMGADPRVEFQGQDDTAGWRITFADTGQHAGTGSRIKKVQRYLPEGEFFVTYGDGVANINLAELLRFHHQAGTVATVTGVHPTSPFGVLEVENGMARTFKEKPGVEGLINGGFFVFSQQVFDYLGEEDGCILEEAPLKDLTRDRQLAVYEHRDFWYCMDTFKQVEELNRLWARGYRPWACPVGE